MPASEEPLVYHPVQRRGTLTVEGYPKVVLHFLDAHLMLNSSKSLGEIMW